jgi:hypothetical protein
MIKPSKIDLLAAAAFRIGIYVVAELSFLQLHWVLKKRRPF